MKIFKSVIAIITVFVFVTSCSKSDATLSAPTVYSEENFLPAFLDESGYVSVSSSTNFGVVIFRPKVKGKINSFIVKLPQAENSLIKIWDVTSNSVLISEVVEVISPNTNTVKVINPLILEKDKDYAISICASNIYKYTRSISSSPPITIGNIQVRGYMPSIGCATSGSSFNAPLSQGVGFGTEIYGSASFNFQQTE
jgi:hypothetical protein